MKAALLPVFVTLPFVVVFWACEFAQVSFFPEQGKTIDLRSPATWLTEQTTVETRFTPPTRMVSFPRVLAAVVGVFLMACVVVALFGGLSRWVLMEGSLLAVFAVFPWVVLWAQHRIPGGANILEFRIYPVTWSYVMGGMALYCVSTHTPRRWFASRVEDLFSKSKSPLLFALTGLVVLVGIQVLMVDARLPVPMGGKETPLDWKKWQVTLSIVGWLHGLVMLGWSKPRQVAHTS